MSVPDSSPSHPESSGSSSIPPCPEFTRSPRGHFPPEVREYALLLRASGVTIADVAARLGCSNEAIRVWTRRAKLRCESRGGTLTRS